MFCLPELIRSPMCRNSKEPGVNLISWGLDSSENSLSFPFSKREEPCFLKKALSSPVVCLLVDSASTIFSFLVTDAIEDVIERSSHQLSIISTGSTSLKVTSCIQGSASENSFSDYYLAKYREKQVQSLSIYKFLEEITQQEITLTFLAGHSKKNQHASYKIA